MTAIGHSKHVTVSVMWRAMLIGTLLIGCGSKEKKEEAAMAAALQSEHAETRALHLEINELKARLSMSQELAAEADAKLEECRQRKNAP